MYSMCVYTCAVCFMVECYHVIRSQNGYSSNSSRTSSDFAFRRQSTAPRLRNCDKCEKFEGVSAHLSVS